MIGKDNMGKFCKNCGVELKEDQQICSKCGTIVDKYLDDINPQDTGSIGWGVLGFFIPLVGLILYFAWKNSMPQNARMAIKGALIGFITDIVFSIIGYIVVVIALIAMVTAYDEFYSIMANNLFL